MPPVDESAATRLATLANELFRLNAIVQQNRMDSNLQEQHYEFVYLIDPHIIEFYAQPDKKRWIEHIDLLPSLRGIGEAPGQTSNTVNTTTASPQRNSNDYLAILRATSLLTSEYIFSNHFVRSSKKLYISPEHMVDFFGIVRRLTSTLDKELFDKVRNSSGLFRSLKSKLEKEIDWHDGNRESTEVFVKRTRDVIVNELATISHSDLLVPLRLERLNTKEILANAQLHRDFTTDVVAPSYKLVKWFEQKIRSVKAQNEIPPSDEALEADAVTLAQLTILNKDYRENKRVFVLITGDNGLHQTYRAWQLEASKERFAALREPRQYVALMNVRDMGGAFTEAAIFETIEKATSTIVDLFGFSEDRPPSLSALKRRLMAPNSNFEQIADIIETQMDSIAANWEEMLRFAIATKSDVFRELAEYEGEFWRRIVAEDFSQPFSGLIKKFETQLESFATTSALLRSERWAVEHSAGNPPFDDYGRREISSRFRGFKSKAFEGKSIAEILRELPKNANTAFESLESAERRERLLISAALCLDIGAWAAASSLLENAILTDASSGGNKFRDPVSREAVFYSSFSKRLCARWFNWERKYQDAAKDLKVLMDTSGDDRFERARVAGEQLALQLCTLAWNVEPTNAENLTAHNDCNNALVTLEVLCAEMEAAEPATVAEDSWCCIRRQWILNTLDLYFWCGILNHPHSTQLKLRTQRALEELESEPVSKQNPLWLTYPIMAKLFLDDENKISDRDKLVSIIDQILKKDRKPNFAYNIPKVDETEFRKIRAFLHGPKQ